MESVVNDVTRVWHVAKHYVIWMAVIVLPCVLVIVGRRMLMSGGAAGRSGQWETAAKSELSDRSAEIPFGVIVLVNDGRLYGGFRLHRGGDEEAGYEWWLLNGGASCFIKGTFIEGKGRLEQRYELIPIDGSKDGDELRQFMLKDLGSELWIRIGNDLALGWSFPNGVYLHGGTTICITEKTEITGICPADAVWRYSTCSDSE